MAEELARLKAEFEASLRTSVEEGRKRGYYPTYFIQMLEQYGGVETAKRLLAKRETQTGLMKLWELKLLDDSLEAMVLKERYQALFTEQERKEATHRLEALGYFPK